MKKRKTFVGVALLVAVLMLGIGYAAISNIDLKITGSASATPSDSNFKVKFTGTPETDATNVSSASTNATVTASVTDDLNATIDVSGLTTTGDYVTATYTILNDSPELAATLAVGEITKAVKTSAATDSTDYFNVTATLKDTEIAATKTTTVTVKVELTKTPVEDKAITITVPITATAKAA